MAFSFVFFLLSFTFCVFPFLIFSLLYNLSSSSFPSYLFFVLSLFFTPGFFHLYPFIFSISHIPFSSSFPSPHFTFPFLLFLFPFPFFFSFLLTYPYFIFSLFNLFFNSFTFPFIKPHLPLSSIICYPHTRHFKSL